MLHLDRSCILKTILCGWLLLGVGHAEPIPDFAINAVISGSTTVSSIALETKALFVDVAGPVFTLQAGYNRIARAKAALTEIGRQLSTTGVDLTQAISTMSLNRSGPIATFFDPISTAIAKLQRIITTELTAQMNILTGDINKYVTDNFLDSFKTLNTTLNSLSQAVTNLRTAVTNARAASGTAVTVSPTDVRKFVTTRVLSDITNGVRLLRSSVPILVFIVRSTLGSFQTADQYLVGLVEEANLREQEVVELGNTNTGDVNITVTTIQVILESDLNGSYKRLNQTYIETLKDSVEADNDFKAVVDGLFNDTKPLFDNLAVGGQIESIFSAYVQLVLALDDDLVSFYGTGMCGLVQNLIQSLIENGPHAQFCFSKYGQKVSNFFVLHSTDVEDCYRLQVTRLEKLVPAVFGIVKLMLHDIEDFIVNVERCDHFNNLQSCVNFLGTEYTTLFGYTATKRDYLYRLVTKETNASFLRLEGCYSNSKHIMLLNAEQMNKDIDDCEINGPTAV